MRLRIVTPLSIAVDLDDVDSIRAEDESGGFGIPPGHADFITALAVSVVSWRQADGHWSHCAIRGGSLSAEGGKSVTVTSREAIVGDDLESLDKVVLARFVAEADAERKEHADSTRMQLAAIRQIMRHLRPADGEGGWR